MKFIRKYSLIVAATLFTLTAMAVMLLFMANRNVEAETLYLTSDPAPDGDTLKVRESGAIEEDTAGTSYEGYLCIPLEAGIAEEDVKISADAGNRTISVTVPVTDSRFYYENNLYGSREHVSSIGVSDLKDRVTFEIRTDDKMAPETVFEGNKLYIAFKPLVELYDRIIVIDAGHGGEDSGTEAYDIVEKDITLGVSDELENITAQDEGVFFLRSGDEDISDKEREEKAEALGADLIISLHTNADKDTRITRGMQILCNNESIMDIAENIADSLKGVQGVDDVSVKKESDTGFFEGTDIPCIVIRLGYMTNKAEAEMMNEKEFQKQTAEAIASVLTKR